MRGLLALNLVLVLGLLQSCMEPQGEITELEFQSGLGKGMASEAAFEATLHPILVRNCAGCHGDSGSNSLKHSLSNPGTAHEVVTSRMLANLNNPSGSTLVTKVRSNHQCWSNCEDNANEIQTAIENWANLAGSGDEVPFDRIGSAAVFKTTVHPLLMNNCAGCHGDQGNQSPKHSVSAFQEAHDAVIDSARVDFANIPNSRLVKRLSDDNHYCWGDCQENANEMQSLIEAWASQIDTTPLTGVNGAKTGALTISQAEIRLPETIGGTVMLQAEDAVLEGRYKIKIDAQASGLKMIVGDPAPTHPFEATPRTSQFFGPGGNNQLCRTVEASHIASGTNGRYREREQRRHVNQAGHRFYSQLVRGRIIRPHLREQYRQALLNGETNLDRFYLTTGEPDNPNNPDGPLEGNPITRQVTRLLPEFMDKATYDSQILNANATSEYADFFAPKHGASGTEYWSATNAELRSGLSIDIKRRGGYDNVMDQFRDFFYDNNNFNDPQNNINSIPFTLRILPDGNVYTNNSQADADAFYNHFMSYPGTSTILTPANANDDMGGGIRRIDTYVQFYMDPADRGFDDFTIRYRNANGSDGGSDFFELRENETVTLDLLNYFSGGEAATPRQIRIANYGNIVKPVFTVNNCFNCHGDGSGRPQFAGNNDEASYDNAAAIGNFFNYADWSNARPVQRALIDRHNCGSNTNCNAVGAQIQAALEQWDSTVQAEIAAAAASGDDGIVALSAKERTPGRAKFQFRVTEAGDYNVWVKTKTDGASNDDMRLRILNSDGLPIDQCDQDQQCSTNHTGTPEQIDARYCETYRVGDNSEWTWYTPNQDNFNNRRKWTLAEGVYTLEVIESRTNVAIDLVALSKNPEFNPRDNLIDEGFVQSKAPKILSYSLQELIGQPGKFEVEVIEKESGDAYIFRAPRIKDANTNVRFRNIKLLINNTFDFGNSTYTKLDRIVDGQDSGLITSAALMALHIGGPSVDSFAFVFEDIAATDQPAVAIDEDNPVPFEGRECQKLQLFERSVMPILNNFRLMFKADYRTYTSSDNNGFPGRNGNAADNPVVYNCTTCHNEDHPYFKMTTFADGLAPGQPIPAEGLATLCKQALSRVDFGNFERSLLLRGLNGTFNHPKLHFIQDAQITGSGDSRRFVTSTSDPSGYATNFIGHRFEKDGNGEYLRISYRTYNDPTKTYDGEIMASNDSFSTNQFGVEILNSSGRNLYNNAAANTNGPFRVKSNCIDVDFVTSGGITQDPCNGNANYETEFENLKQKYRDAVINWMQREKDAYDNLN